MSSKAHNGNQSQYLIINKIDRETSTLGFIDDSNSFQPLYNIFYSKKTPNVRIYHHFSPADVVGTIGFHSLSSKIEVSFDNRQLTMVRKHSLSSGHNFIDPTGDLGEIRWKETSLLGSDVALVDQEGRTFMRYRKKMPGKHEGSGFEIYRPMNQKTLEMAVVTGIGAAEYRRQSNKEWGDIVEEALGV